MSSLMRFFTNVFILNLMLVGSSFSGDWPQWLGPDRDGIAVGERVPVPKAGEVFPTNWKMALGEGWAAPVVVGGKVVIHHRPGAEESIDCLEDSSGKLLWRYSFPSGYRDGFGMAEGPRSTPTIAGGKVFAYGPQGLLHCLDFANGKLRWSVNVAREFNSPKGFFGRCSSPLVVGELVMIDVGGPGAGVVAFDAGTGKPRWKSGDYENDYSSPVHARIGDLSCALFFLRDGFLGLNVKTGKELFFERFRSPINASVNAATPLLVGNTVFVTSCYDVGGAAWLLKPNGEAGVGVETLWKKGNLLDGHYATPVHRDGYLYGFHGRQERGPELRCVSLADGSVQWTSGRMESGNLLLADGKLITLTEDGELLLAPASRKGFTVVHRQQILGLETRAHFAISNGKLFARDKRRLVCLQLNKDK